MYFLGHATLGIFWEAQTPECFLSGGPEASQLDPDALAVLQCGIHLLCPQIQTDMSMFPVCLFSGLI